VAFLAKVNRPGGAGNTGESRANGTWEGTG
jgi:hypothetical protein